MKLKIMSLAFVLVGCANPTNVPNEEAENIFGEWIQFPDSNKISIAFDEKGNYIEKRNGTTTVQTTFKFADLSPTMTYPIEFGKKILNCNDRYLHGFLGKDTLILMPLGGVNNFGDFYFIRRDTGSNR